MYTEVKVKVYGVVQLATSLTATGTNVPYGITQCYQPPGRSDIPALTPTKMVPYSITERRVPKLIPVLGSEPAGNVSHKPGGRLPLLSARPAVTFATLKRATTSFAAW